MEKVIELNEHNVRPLIGKVLVRRIVETVTKGGLELPDISKDMPNPDGTLPKRGTVLRVSDARMIADVTEEYNKDPEKYGVVIGGLNGGPVAKTEAALYSVPLQVRVGDVVVFNKYGGRPFCDDQDLLLIAEEEILAVEYDANI